MDKIYEMALEMLSPVTEATISSIAAFVSKDCKEGKKSKSEALKLARTGDINGAKKKYKEAITSLESVRKRIAGIHDDNILDIIIHGPLSILVPPYGVARLGLGNFNLKGLTREGAYNIIETIIFDMESQLYKITRDKYFVSPRNQRRILYDTVVNVQD